MAHPAGKRKSKAKTGSKVAQTFTLKTTRDGWVKDAYKKGTPEYLARTVLAEKA